MEPNLFIKLISILRCYAAVELAKKIYKSGVKFVFLGHTVYSNRALLGYLRNKKIKIFTQAAFNLHSQFKSRDNSWQNISKDKFKLVKKKLL